RELVLPPSINEAPPGAEIVLPPPGQEALFEKPALAADNKVQARVGEEKNLKIPANFDLPPVQQAEAPAATETTQPVVAEIQAEAAPVLSAEAGVEAKPQSRAKKRKQAGRRTAIAQASPRLEQKPEFQVADASSSRITQTDYSLAPGTGGPEIPGEPTANPRIAAATAERLSADTAIAEGDTISEAEAKSVFTPEAPAPQPVLVAQAQTGSPRVVDPMAKNYERAEGPNHGSARSWDWSVDAAVGYGGIDGAAQGLPIEFRNGPAVRSLKADSDDEFFGLSAGVTANLDGHIEPLSFFGARSDAKPWLRVEGGGFDAEFKTSSAQTDTIGAETLFLLRADDSPINLGGGTNVRNVAYKASEDVRYVKVLYGQTYGQRVTWVPYGGVAYTNRDVSQRLSFQAGAGTAARFSNDIDVNTYSFILGLKVDVPVDNAGHWSVDGHVKASYDISDASGTAVSDINGGVQSRRLNKTRDSLGFGAGAGINYRINESAAVRLGVDYVNTDASPVVRYGANGAHLDLQDEDIFVGTLRTTFTF
ncbi:MAG TPA: hypothetical protein DCL48_06275, partial [Alphaproteobacteria bacterium]|nr:hypothetical protein [Alphaproteobacteria bacterium]